MGSRASRHKRRLFAAHPYCHWCGLGPLHPDYATLDHLVPKSKGGTNERANLVIACWECNQKKGNADWSDREPKGPAPQPAEEPHHTDLDEIDEEW